MVSNRRQVRRVSEERVDMVTIYGTSVCLSCIKAKELANDYGLDWEFKNVSYPKYLSEFTQKFPGRQDVPQIEWHGKWLGGYSEFASEIENTRNYGDGQI